MRANPGDNVVTQLSPPSPNTLNKPQAERQGEQKKGNPSAPSFVSSIMARVALLTLPVFAAWLYSYVRAGENLDAALPRQSVVSMLDLSDIRRPHLNDI